MKNFIIFLCVVVIFTLIFLISTGAFCFCSDVKCPSSLDEETDKIGDLTPGVASATLCVKSPTNFTAHFA